MRWKAGKVPKDGDIQIIEKFLLFPRRIDNEMIWLEAVTIMQVYACGFWSDIKTRCGRIAHTWKLENALDKGGE